MGTQLHWPRRSTFHQPGRDDTEERYYDGPGTFEVPDDRVEQYLDRGWERPEDAEAEEAPAPASQDESEPDADSEEADSEEFDAAGFVDDSWQSVTSRIEAGEADGHLDAVEAAEQDRDGDPRSSVIEAVDSRR